MQIPKGQKLAQWALLAAAYSNPLGTLIFVDSTNGSDGNSGADPLHPLQTLTRALALAEAGDTIVLAPGGSEVVTATLAVAVAGLRIICPTENPESGFTISGAGTLALMTVSAADVTVKGLKFAHTGTTSSAACILTTAAADRLHVENCLFDDSAIVTTYTGYGIEITDDCLKLRIKDCVFKDLINGVRFTIATAKAQIGTRIEGCIFYVGQSAAFGVLSSISGSGTVRALEILRCIFMEAKGSGAAAAVAWDGTSGANGTQGPISLGAAVDQYIVADCRAFTALSQPFDSLNAINTGAIGELVNNLTKVGAGNIGEQFVISSTVVSSSIPNNTQTGGAITGPAAGNVLVEDMIFETGATGVAGPTNIEISTDNVSGLNSAAAPLVLQAVSALGANKSVVARVTSTTKVLPFLLESGKKIYIDGDDGAGTGAGTLRVTMVCRRASKGAYLAAANLP